MGLPYRFREAIAFAAGQHDLNRPLQTDPVSLRDENRPDSVLGPQHGADDRILMVPPLPVGKSKKKVLD